RARNRMAVRTPSVSVRPAQALFGACPPGPRVAGLAAHLPPRRLEQPTGARQDVRLGGVVELGEGHMEALARQAHLPARPEVGGAEEGCFLVEVPHDLGETPADPFT